MTLGERSPAEVAEGWAMDMDLRRVLGGDVDAAAPAAGSAAI